MLDFFLVLGQVPGTDFFITFEQILAAMVAALLIILQIKMDKPHFITELRHDIQLFYLKMRHLYFRSRII